LTVWCLPFSLRFDVAYRGQLLEEEEGEGRKKEGGLQVSCRTLPSSSVFLLRTRMTFWALLRYDACNHRCHAVPLRVAGAEQHHAVRCCGHRLPYILHQHLLLGMPHHTTTPRLDTPSHHEHPTSHLQPHSARTPPHPTYPAPACRLPPPLRSCLPDTLPHRLPGINGTTTATPTSFLDGTGWLHKPLSPPPALFLPVLAKLQSYALP